MQKKEPKSSRKIDKIEETSETLTGRGGMALYVKYLNKVGVYSLLWAFLGVIKKNKKGIEQSNIFKQIFCCLYDGTSRHISYFDELKNDEGYASVLENSKEEMASTDQIKRFFKLFACTKSYLFRKTLRKMFIWRLKLEQPALIEMTIDTMVMDNDEAEKRHGVQPTYKKEKGFQPLQMILNGKIVDAEFRSGSKHSNYGNSVVKMVTEVVKEIRKGYRKEVTIILRLDSGFFDQKNLKAFDELGIGFICTGKIYDDIKNHVSSLPARDWEKYSNGRQKWEYIEFNYKCASWDWRQYYRTFYTRRVTEESGQKVFKFARPDNVVLTNLGLNDKALINCSAAEARRLTTAKSIIKSNHMRGADELPHRGLKDFGFETLPFKRFSSNSALYYCMLISFFLFETYKEDVLSEVIPMESYATTVRRKVLDFACKVTTTGGEIILKVPKAIMENLEFRTLWERSQNPIPI